MQTRYRVVLVVLALICGVGLYELEIPVGDLLVYAIGALVILIAAFWPHHRRTTPRRTVSVGFGVLQASMILGIVGLLAFGSIRFLEYQRVLDLKDKPDALAYIGEAYGYEVEIYENNDEGLPRRVVHMKEAAHPGHVVVGWDQKGNGSWNRVYPARTNKCGLVILRKGAGLAHRRWVPCGADKDKPPFTDSEVMRAMGLLYLATSEVFNHEHYVGDLVKQQHQNGS